MQHYPWKRSLVSDSPPPDPAKEIRTNLPLTQHIYKHSAANGSWTPWTCWQNFWKHVLCPTDSLLARPASAQPLQPLNMLSRRIPKVSPWGTSILSQLNLRQTWPSACLSRDCRVCLFLRAWSTTIASCRPVRGRNSRPSLHWRVWEKQRPSSGERCQDQIETLWMVMFLPVSHRHYSDSRCRYGKVTRSEIILCTC